MVLPFDIPTSFDRRWIRKVMPSMNSLHTEELREFSALLLDRGYFDESTIVESVIRQRDEPNEHEFDKDSLPGTLGHGTGGGHRVIRSTKGLS